MLPGTLPCAGSSGTAISRFSTGCMSLVSVGADHILVRGLDCLDGTPLIDIKPERCPEAPRPKGEGGRAHG